MCVSRPCTSRVFWVIKCRKWGQRRLILHELCDSGFGKSSFFGPQNAVTELTGAYFPTNCFTTWKKSRLSFANSWKWAERSLCPLHLRFSRLSRSPVFRKPKCAHFSFHDSGNSYFQDAKFLKMNSHIARSPWIMGFTDRQKWHF